MSYFLDDLDLIEGQAAEVLAQGVMARALRHYFNVHIVEGDKKRAVCPRKQEAERAARVGSPSKAN
jgi:hypothetical protein